MDNSMNMDPYARNSALMQPAVTDTQAFFMFPFMVVMAYLWPTPTTFTRLKNHATGGILTVLLVAFTLLSGLCMYAWGRLPSLSRGIQLLGLAHLAPQPLSPISTGILALLVPLLILGWAFALHKLAHMQQGKGSYRVQLYSVLVIATPLLLLVIAVALLLSIVPAMGTIVRIPLALVSLLLLLYSLFLHLPSLMGIQQLSMGKAAICLITIFIFVLLLFLASDMFDTQHGGGGGTSDRHFKRPKNQHERYCSRCSFSLAVYDKLHPTTLTQSCPKCGNPLF